MAEVKGVQLKGCFAFYREYYGEGALNAAIMHLGVEDRALLPPVFFDSNWYPYDTWNVLRKLARILRTGAEPLNQPVIYGKYIADYLLNGVYRSLVARDPTKQVGRFATVHEFFYRDTSTLEVRLVSSSSCTVRYLYDYDVKPAASTCLSTLGFWVRVLELSGASNVEASHPVCMSTGKSFCEFIFEWQTTA